MHESCKNMLIRLIKNLIVGSSETTSSKRKFFPTMFALEAR